MPAATDVAGLAGVALVFPALAVASVGLAWPASRAGTARLRTLRIAAAVAALAALTPVRGLPLAAYLRAFTDDLSLASVVLLGVFLARSVGLRVPAARPGDRTVLRALILAAATLLYPGALSNVPFDAYRWGFGEPGLPVAVAAGGAIALAAGLRLTALVLASALLAHGIGLYESRNLWQYLIDPLIAVHALVAVLAGAARAAWRTARRRVLPPAPARP